MMFPYVKYSNMAIYYISMLHAYWVATRLLEFDKMSMLHVYYGLHTFLSHKSKTDLAHLSLIALNKKIKIFIFVGNGI